MDIKKPEEDDEEDEGDEEDEDEDDDIGDSCVDGLSEIIDFYNNNIGLITPYALETLTDYAKTMSDELVLFAMKKAVEANVRTIKYIKGILNNWSKKGIKTLVEAEQEDLKFEQKKSEKKMCGSKPDCEQRNYTGNQLNQFYVN